MKQIFFFLRNQTSGLLWRIYITPGRIVGRPLNRLNFELRTQLNIPFPLSLSHHQLMNVGLIYTSASVYQMLRGAVVIFTGTFSWLFLHRQLRVYKWASLFLVVFGVSIVGLSSVLFPQKKPSNLLRGSDNHPEEPFDWESAIGVAMVLGAQIFTATQFVIEEKVMAKYSVPPLRAVGLEGTFGLTSVLAAMPVLYLLFGKSHPGGYFDLYETWRQVTTYPQVWGTGIAIAFSIAFFNFFGLSVTASVNATARSTIDTCRYVHESQLRSWISVAVCGGLQSISAPSPCVVLSITPSFLNEKWHLLSHHHATLKDPLHLDGLSRTWLGTLLVGPSYRFHRACHGYAYLQRRHPVLLGPRGGGARRARAAIVGFGIRGGSRDFLVRIRGFYFGSDGLNFYSIESIPECLFLGIFVELLADADVFRVTTWIRLNYVHVTNWKISKSQGEAPTRVIFSPMNSLLPRLVHHQRNLARNMSTISPVHTEDAPAAIGPYCKRSPLLWADSLRNAQVG
ncbi:hypothetical protein BC936DRAFT_141658 [Jimgerdemannia flammicorona]|uniref:Uncharacterized protein n=1 Tax=Jimgerdemannia flammicorona TaxID=994334 RepID=A0A433A1T6_9FUNG|nr:hypothetical protein BC936DRAFT_141658 [Jimgerdemannia flammicorona]